MKTFLLQQDPIEGKAVLTGEDFHYLCHVRRLKQGDFLQIKDSRNHIWESFIEEVSQKSCTLVLKKDLGSLPEMKKRIYLFLCLPKGKKTDLIIRQAAETGVYRVLPLQSRHSMVKLGKEKERGQKGERWNRIVREALQQSGSSVRTEVLLPESFSILEKYSNMTVFYFHQDRIRDISPGELLQDSGDEIGIVIGPEGGLSTEEIHQMDHWGFHPLFLGDNVLRTETAALYGIAMIQTILGEI